MEHTSPDVTLVTYTYNDAHFVHGLLDEARTWSVRPTSIVVVDDGSKIPFAPLREASAPLKVIRLDPNQGITTAKRTGMNAATGEYIFSVDCDVRLTPNYLERCLLNIQIPGVGLCSGASFYNSGDDLVSRYLKYYGDNHNVASTGKVEFIPGNAFFLRRTLWEEVGGFGDYSISHCEDHVLCKRIKESGYILYSDASIKAKQTRRLERHTMCMRIWQWCHRELKNHLPQKSDVIPIYLFEYLGSPVQQRIETNVKINELMFIYIDLLYMILTVSDMIEFACERGVLNEQDKDGFYAVVLEPIHAYHRLFAMLKIDFALASKNTKRQLPHVQNQPAPKQKEKWDLFGMVIQSLSQSGFFRWFEQQGVDALIAESKSVEYDFSSYAECDHTYK
ncbi:MAG: glycosyltransferase [Thermodesulfobacteriota bacterium]